jgi:hypothetical protein
LICIRSTGDHDSNLIIVCEQHFTGIARNCQPFFLNCPRANKWQAQTEAGLVKKEKWKTGADCAKRDVEPKQVQAKTKAKPVPL